MRRRPLARSHVALTSATLLTGGLAHAADGSAPEVAVVGLHVGALSAEEGNAASNDLARTLDANGFEAIAPTEVRTRLVGRESLVLRATLARTGDAHANEGRVLYQRADFAGAVASFEAAVEAYDATASASRDFQPFVDALTRLAMAAQATGDERRARSAMAEVVALSRNRPPDPLSFPPAVTRLFEETRSAMLATSPATLEVRSKKPDATVYVDGENRGEAPVVIEDLLPGTHFVQVTRADGYRSLQRIELLAGSPETWEAPVDERVLLEPAPDAGSRQAQIDALYHSLGEHLGTPFVLVGGEVDDHLSLQLYEVTSGRYSRPIQTEGTASVGPAAQKLAGELKAALGPDGRVSVDRMTSDPAALDAASNQLLADILLHPTPVTEPQKLTAVVAAEPRSRWVAWTSIAVAVAGASAAGAYFVLKPDDPDPNRGVVVVCPGICE